MQEITEEFIEDLILDASISALPGVAATFGDEIENRLDLIAYKACRLGEKFANKWVEREGDRRYKVAGIVKRYNEQQ